MFQKSCTTNKQNKAQSYWLALALDMDDCFMHQSYINARQAQIAAKGTDLTMEEEEALFIRENKPALDRIVLHTRNHYKRLYLLLGTKRQDLSIDELNSRLRGTISAFHGLEMITRYLKSQLPAMPVKQLNFAMADTATGQIGMTYERALNYLKGKDQNPQPQWEGVDSDKLTITYAHAHLLAQEQEYAGEPLNGESEQIIYALIDDNEPIRDKMRGFVRQNPLQFPQGMGFLAINYSDADPVDLDELAAPTDVRYGTGEPDEYFMETISSIEETYAVESCWPEQNYNYRSLSFNNARHAHDLITPKRLEVAVEHVDNIQFNF